MASWQLFDLLACVGATSRSTSISAPSYPSLKIGVNFIYGALRDLESAVRFFLLFPGAGCVGFVIFAGCSICGCAVAWE